MITLYTIHCPQCNVLKKKLDAAGISYSLIDDRDWLIQHSFNRFPILEVDGIQMNFAEARKWLEEKTKV